MATNFEAKLAYIPSFGSLALRKGLEYRNANGGINSAKTGPTSCKNMVNFSPVIRRSCTWLNCVSVKEI